MTSTELVHQRNYRHEIPKEHRASLDTRLRWLWNQRFGTLQTIWKDSPDPLDQTAATTVMQALVQGDMNSIVLLFNRLEGGPQADEEVLERSTIRV